MAREVDLPELVALAPDERLLGEDLNALPGSVGQPPSELPESATRRRVVRTGATLTGATLIGGLAVTLAGIVEAIANGGLAWWLVLVLGVVLVSTHWGWVHVAELAGNRIEGHRTATSDERRHDWLESIEPFPRWEVGTTTDQDGSISIVTTRYSPVPARDGTFTFQREDVAREVHSSDETAAAVAERAELVRRQAAADTQQARELYEAAHDAYERAVLAHADEQERLAAARAASEALSEQINANLRDPPLVE